MPFARKVFLNLLLGLVAVSVFISISEASSQDVTSKLVGKHWQAFEKMQSAGFVVQDGKGVLIQGRNQEHAFVPASTTKLITALLAMEHWGAAHRFYTDFYLQPTNGQPILVVKGYGDPFLVSEELQVLADSLQARLAQQGVSGLSGIKLDVSFYKSGLLMPGTRNSNNPYDAIPSALAANFNTIHVAKKLGMAVSAEPQTPLVPAGIEFVNNSPGFKRLKHGQRLRVNLGSDVKLAQRYFAELLSSFIRSEGVPVGDKVVWGTVNASDKQLYRHYNSRNLAEVIKPMMQYSTNFIANQIALNLSADVLGGQANKSNVEKTYFTKLQQRFGWQEFNIEEGAGLSRSNRLTPVQLIDVLHAFKPFVHLLPEVEQKIFAKSGSLIGVSTLAGYLQKDNELWPFAIMINQPVPYRFRNRLAKELAEAY